MNNKRTDTILKINSSGKQTGSVSRELTASVVTALQRRGHTGAVIERDVASGIPFVNEAWITANFTAEDARTEEQRTLLSYSDNLVDELLSADILVLGVPIYNFGVPATFKAWVDMIARAGKTFRYTENGPLGLAGNKKAYLVITSGGTTLGSDIDFASGYVKQALKFVGITDVTVIDAAAVATKGLETVMQSAQQQISEIDYALSA